jgi:hypothetical protein
MKINSERSDGVVILLTSDPYLHELYVWICILFTWPGSCVGLRSRMRDGIQAT